MSEAILEIEHLIKKYDELTVINDLSLSVKKGEVIVIVGSSGCGKSTLLRCLNGLENIQGGSIKLNGEPVDGPESRPRLEHGQSVRRLL